MLQCYVLMCARLVTAFLAGPVRNHKIRTHNSVPHGAETGNRFYTENGNNFVLDWVFVTIPCSKIHLQSLKRKVYVSPQNVNSKLHTIASPSTPQQQHRWKSLGIQIPLLKHGTVNYALVSSSYCSSVGVVGQFPSEPHAAEPIISGPTSQVEPFFFTRACCTLPRRPLLF
jgi:hypothetical protein